jgi:hypothetical protein
MPRRLVTPVLVALATLVPVAVHADECPQLIRAIRAAADIRFDQSAHDARAKAVEAARLHAEGRHEAAAKVAREGCLLLAIACPAHSTR